MKTDHAKIIDIKSQAKRKPVVEDPNSSGTEDSDGVEMAKSEAKMMKVKHREKLIYLN